MITGMLDKGVPPILERLMQVRHRRHQMLAYNVANLSTPYFKLQDIDTDGFQRALRRSPSR